ncbi:MAG: hypothetical protein K6F00_02290, partial [Lachnospiraceae bacterium]|nr:hypothetical protein [Lachnospiraceae bacterium]
MDIKTMLSATQTLAPYLRISKDRCEILSGITDDERFGAVLYGLVIGTPPKEMVEVIGKITDTDQLFAEFHQRFIERNRDTEYLVGQIEEKRIQVDKTIASHDELMGKYHEELKILMEHTIKDSEEKV